MLLCMFQECLYAIMYATMFQEKTILNVYYYNRRGPNLYSIQIVIIRKDQVWQWKTIQKAHAPINTLNQPTIFLLL